LVDLLAKAAPVDSNYNDRKKFAIKIQSWDEGS
jgi:hypothetical protein